MTYVLTGIYKMKKRRISEVTATSNCSVGKAPNPESAQPHHQFLRDSSSLSTATTATASTSARSALISPKMPRQSSRINSVESHRISHVENTRSGSDHDKNLSTVVESPESQGPIICWKYCNSPEYLLAKNKLTSKVASENDLQDIVRQFVPSTRKLSREPSSSSLLDLWMAPCETPPDARVSNKYIETGFEQHKSKRLEQAVRGIEELIEQVERGQMQLANPVRIQDSVNDVWSDDDLFEDENVITLTQQMEEVHKEKPKNVFKENDNWTDDELFDTTFVTNLNPNDRPINQCSPDIVDCAAQIIDDDSMMTCPTQLVVADENNVPTVISPDLMDIGFVQEYEEDTVEFVPEFNYKVSQKETEEATSELSSPKVCAYDEIARKREEAMMRRNARSVKLKPKNIFSVFASDSASTSTTFNTVPEVDQSTNSASVISQVIPPSQMPCTQDEIQRKKEEALKRRSARLAAQAKFKTVAVPLTKVEASKKERDEQRHLCTQQEIERKKLEALEKRQKRLMLIQQQEQQQQKNLVDFLRPRCRHLVPSN